MSQLPASIHPLALALLGVLLTAPVLLWACAGGEAVPQGETADRVAEQAGAGHPARGTSAAEQRDELRRQLSALGYLTGYKPATGKVNVTLHLPEKAQPGLNLCNGGHGQSAFLTDMEGRILHHWAYVFSDVPLGADARKPVKDEKPLFWRRVHLFPNGDLLVVVTGYGLIKLNRESTLIWAAPCPAHHDLCVTEEGLIYALTWRKGILRRISREKQVREDFITVFDSEGRQLRRQSLLVAFENSPYREYLEPMLDFGHLLHTNTIEVFDGSQARRSPLFRQGNVLVSMRNLSAIAIVDLDQGQVVWAMTGDWREQHQPTLLDNGRMLLFDNCGHPGGSKVVEFDPFTGTVHWSYEGNEENGFDSPVLGSCSRLPNGNTLITDSVNGRAFEVTPAGEMVWEFYNPTRAAADPSLVATLLEVQRIDPATLGDWINTENK
jgi:hypothetical protein